MKPDRASGYTPASLALARAGCLELATIVTPDSISRFVISGSSN